LLDQSVIAGLGNIYVCEALWLAAIRPTLRAHRLSRARANRLVGAIRDVLDRALGLGGTSLRDFVAADGAVGENVHYLRVYDRAGTPCPRRGCDGVVKRRVVGGRATFYCPRCQKG
jgi:formamidopyrimidine-DNA glycosylase